MLLPDIKPECVAGVVGALNDVARWWPVAAALALVGAWTVLRSAWRAAKWFARGGRIRVVRPPA